jgi:hypothetical protein
MQDFHLMMKMSIAGNVANALQRCTAAACALGLVLIFAGTARAQGVGFVAGASVDPEQFYVGTFFETPRIADQVRLRPGIDGSWGDGLKIAAINIDVIYRSDRSSPWQFYTGAGPTIYILRFDDDTIPRGADTDEVTGGFSGVIGFAHASGFFAEFRAGHGGDNAPHLKIGAGFKF